MNNSFKTNFIPQTIEKTPFADTPAQNFFGVWCKIIPQFISRKEWEQRGIQRILEENDQGKQTLFLPEDLHLWEMMDVIETVDHDTLLINPENRGERAGKIKELGEIFEKAGIYLSEYPTIENPQGKEIAEHIAREFHLYG